MKTTVEIPRAALEEAMRHSGARTPRDAIVTAIEEYNHRRRLDRLAGQLGTFEGFISQEELTKLRSEG